MQVLLFIIKWNLILKLLSVNQDNGTVHPVIIDRIWNPEYAAETQATPAFMVCTLNNTAASTDAFHNTTMEPNLTIIIVTYFPFYKPFK